MEVRNVIVEELASMVVKQSEEIKKLKRRIILLKQYIEVYEEYIKGEDYRWER